MTAEVTSREANPYDARHGRVGQEVSIMATSEAKTTRSVSAKRGLPGAGSPRDDQGGIPVAKLGQGYDTFANSGRSTLVTGTVTNSGVTSKCYYRVCYDVETLKSSLHISAAVSASFGVDSVDAKSRFVRELNVTTTSLSIVVYTNVINSNQVYTEYQIPGQLPQDANTLFQEYGDSFVSHLVKGAEYMAVYVFYCQSKQEQLELASTLKANGIAEGGVIGGELQASLDSVQSQVTQRQTLQQLITGFTHPDYPGPGGIIDFALNFGKKTPDAPAVVSYGTTGYEHAGTMPAGFPTIVANRALFLGNVAKPGLAQNLASRCAVLNQVEWIQETYAVYGGFVDTTLESRKTHIVADRETLATLIDTIDGNPTVPATQPELLSLRYGSPVLTYQVSPAGGQVWGGWGGESFPEDVTGAAVVAHQVLQRIVLQGDKWMDAISLTYTSSGGLQTYVHGGQGGSDSNPFTLNAGEVITSVGYSFGRYVNQLTLTTSLRQTMSWPPDPDSAPNNGSYTVPSGSVLLGFQGRSDRYLDQLQPILLTFSPATWVQP
jgi:hypothetical protein